MKSRASRHRRSPDHYTLILTANILVGITAGTSAVTRDHLGHSVMAKIAISYVIAAAPVLMALGRPALARALPNQGNWLSLPVGATYLGTFASIPQSWAPWPQLAAIVAFVLAVMLDTDAARQHLAVRSSGAKNTTDSAGVLRLRRILGDLARYEAALCAS